MILGFHSNDRRYLVFCINSVPLYTREYTMYIIQCTDDVQYDVHDAVQLFNSQADSYQQLNQTIIDNIKNQDYKQIVSEIRDGIIKEMAHQDSQGVIFGLSGGIDSSVVAYLCKELGNKALGIVMPDTDITPEQETRDALKVVALTGIAYKLIDIKPIVNEYSMYIEPNKRAKGNLRARVRANILYYYANVKGYLVLGTSDKSEYMLGYFTKFGDGAADIVPISSMYKLQIREIAKYLGVPTEIISKKSSPHLWSDHDAQDEIGATYEEIDSIIYCMEKGMDVSEIAKTTQIDSSTIQQIISLNKNTHHKRIIPQDPRDHK